MSLSILPLTQPMYNIYKAFNEVHKRYGNDVYVDCLIRPVSTPGAPTNVVRSLAETYVDNLLALYNARVSVQKRVNSEMGLMNFYFALSIIILTGLIFLISHSITKYREMLLKTRTPEEVQEQDKFLIIYRVAGWIGYAFLLALAVLTYKRKVDIAKVIGKVNFSDSSSIISPEMKNVFGQFINASVAKGSKFCKYVLNRESARTKRLEMRRFVELTPFTKLFKWDKGTKIWKPIAASSPIQSSRQAIFAYVLSQRGVVIDMAAISGSDMRFPGFDQENSSPSILYREIQAVDIIGQVTRLSDAVAFFKDFLAKKGGPVASADSGSASGNAMRIVDSIKGLFAERKFMSRNLIPVRLHESIMRNDLKTAQECMAAAQASPSCVYSVYNSLTGACALVNKDQVANFPLFYVKDDPNVVQPYEVFVKDKNEIYLSHTMRIADLLKDPKGLTTAMRFVDDRETKLDLESGCVYKADGGVCKGQNYQSVVESINLDAIFHSNRYEDVAALLNKQDDVNVFTVRTTTESLIDHAMSKGFAMMEKNRNQFGDIVVDIIKKADPSGNFVLDGDSITEIADAAGSAYPDHAAEMKSLITDVLNEVPVRLARIAALAEMDTTDNRDMRYVTGQELSDKLAAMNPHEFVTTFTTHLYNIYACSEGLRKMQRVYDYTIQDIERGTTILSLLATLVMLQGIVYGVYFGMTNYPVYAHADKEAADIIKTQEVALINSKMTEDEKRKTKEIITKQSDIRTGLLTDFGIKALVVASAFIITTVLISMSAQRRQGIGMYNYDVMMRNGDILSQSSKTLLNHVYDDIWGGRLLYTSGEAPFGFLPTDIYSIDRIRKHIGSVKQDGHVMVNDIAGQLYRDELVDMIEAHEKCNALLFGANLPMPFPTYEISIYVFLIIVIAVCGAVLTYKMRPGTTLSNLKLWNRVKVNRNRNKMIVMSEINLSGEDPEELGKDTDLILKILTLIMIPIATLLFAGTLVKSTSDLQTTLYGSNLYRSNTCYDL